MEPPTSRLADNKGSARLSLASSVLARTKLNAN